VPYFICPNCKARSIDHDRREGLSQDAVACHHCGFGFLFELLEDYYPAPATGFVVCDQQSRVIAAGRDVFELSGFREEDGQNPAQLSLEWGVRRMGEQLEMRTRVGHVKPVTADFFPAYDEDGGLLVAITPR
jgi:hypothetical protein